MFLRRIVPPLRHSYLCYKSFPTILYFSKKFCTNGNAVPKSEILENNILDNADNKLANEGIEDLTEIQQKELDINQLLQEEESQISQAQKIINQEIGKYKKNLPKILEIYERAKGENLLNTYILNNIIYTIGLSRGLDDVQGIFQEMKELSISPNWVTFQILITLAGKEGRHKEMFDLLKIMRTNLNIPIHSETVNIIIKYLLKSNLISVALQVMETFMISGEVEQKYLVNKFYVILFHLSNEGKLEELVKCMDLMHKFGIERNSVCYAAIFDCLDKCDRFDLFLSYYDEWKDSSYVNSLLAANYAMGVFASRKELAPVEEILKLMKINGKKLNAESYSHLIKLYSGLDQYSEVNQCFLKMKKRNIPVTLDIYHVLIENASAKKQKYSSLFPESFFSMKENGISPNQITFTLCMRLLDNFEDFVSFLDIWDKLFEFVVASNINYSAVAQFIVDHKPDDKTGAKYLRKFIEQAIFSSFPVDVRCLSLLVRASVRVRDYQLVELLFDNYHYVYTDISSYTRIINTISSLNHVPALLIYEKMKALTNITPSLEILNCLLSVTCKYKDHKNVAKLMNDFKAFNIQPDCTTNNHLLLYNRHLSNVVSILDSINSSSGIDIFLGNKFVSLFAEKGDLPLIEKVVKKWAQFNIKPNSQTIDIIIKHILAGSIPPSKAVELKKIFSAVDELFDYKMNDLATVKPFLNK